MKHALLGASGVGTSVYALGTATFGEHTDEEEASRVLEVFVDAGGLLVDTADGYADGRAEEIVGRWLARQPAEVRSRVLLSTKGGGYTTSAAMNEWGNTRHNLTRALNTSLRSLGVDSITLYQVHTWDPLTPLEETLSFADDAVRQGKIQYLGLSNFTGWQLQKAVDTARRLGLTAPVVYQAQYNLLCREIEWEIIPAGTANGLGLLAWSPLSGGLLTDKYSAHARPDGDSRFTEQMERGKMHDNYVAALYQAHVTNERTWAVLKILRDIAVTRGVTPAAVALAWVAARPGVSSVILGARTSAQLAANLAARDLTLDAEEITRLNEASDPCPAGYPYGAFGAMQRSRSIQ
ncbi:aldo/keto reductase [Saccharopolyspora phatthalungensis]|uniref:Aryl-alcohol dehydrogenase-like predicted oxidoreductase n=1 Tax=Saccharopolyspora phatthalungensis TaxID=664693 RepID=A0A840QIL8_9PSEU|nr:aldo/keto reductase [Saccharopolyspora phatthalungensis]MBB5158738.1 aryl-alcohol dehydrogenase-like predicted oxidoreductase [Saccharopolyspora phatthalungensis]